MMRHIFKTSVRISAAAVMTACVFFTGCATPPPAPTSQPADVKPTVAEPAEEVTVQRYIDRQGDRVAVELSNGMVVIAKAVRKAPVVCVKGYVRAGGMYEGKYLGCGVSHLLEHLVAKDNDNIAGLANAGTNKDYTCYYISASSAKTDECIEFIADTLAHPTFTEADFNREHGVVQRELEMGKDDPDRILYYANDVNVYGTHPAAVPVIGFAGPLSRLTFADVRNYHHLMYAPQNMVFVIVGDIDPEKAVEKTRRSLAGFCETTQANLTLPEVAPVASTRKMIQPSKAFRETAVVLNFQTIPLVHKDLYALDVLSYILTNGESSRLVRKMVFEKKLVTAIDSYSYTPSWGKGTFTILFRCKPELAEKATEAIIAELKTIKKNGFTTQEGKQARTQKIADYVNSQQTVEGIAGSLGTDMLTVDDLDFSKLYTEKIQKTSGPAILKAAQKYFDFDRMIITQIVPQPYFDKVLAKAEKNAKKTDAGKPEVFTLENGMKVVLCPTPEIPKVAMTMIIRGGLIMENPKTNGLGAFVAAMSTRGAGPYDDKQISGFFNSAGGSISAISGDNSWVYAADVLSDKFDKSLKIFSDVVLHPTFPEGEMKGVRELLLADIKRSDEHWFAKLNKFHRAKFYTNSPWKMPREGSEKVVQDATPQQLKRFHDAYMLAGNAALAIYGDFDVAKTRSEIEKLFGKMKTGKTALPKVQPRKIDANGEFYVQQAPMQQAGVMISANAPTVDNVTDRLPLMVLDTIISGYYLPSGWMHDQLRGKQLVYVVHTIQKSGFLPGGFTTYAGTQPQQAPQVVKIITDNLKKAATYTPTQEEIDKAVKQIVTSELLANQSLDALSFNAAVNELYGLGVNWPAEMEKRLSAVTPQQVKAAAEKYLTGGYVITVVTPQPQLLKEFQQAGNVK